MNSLKITIEPKRFIFLFQKVTYQKHPIHERQIVFTDFEQSYLISSDSHSFNTKLLLDFERYWTFKKFGLKL